MTKVLLEVSFTLQFIPKIKFIKNYIVYNKGLDWTYEGANVAQGLTTLGKTLRISHPQEKTYPQSLQWFGVGPVLDKVKLWLKGM